MRMVAKGYKIGTAAQRKALPVRREPYWTFIQTGGYLGYRRTPTGGSWVVRWRKPDGKQAYEALKLPLNVPEEEARDVAQKAALRKIEEWQSGAVVATGGGYKLSDAATAYVKVLRARKGDAAADDALGRINRKLAKSSLWDRRVDRLTKGEIEDWLHGLVPAGLDDEAHRRAKDSANRNLTTLKAILNHAWRSQRVASPNAWATVEAFANVSQSRRTFLSLEQRRRLLEKTEGTFRHLLEAAMLTGARYGELRQLTVSDFDKDARTLEIHKGKTGVRTVALADAAYSFFVRQAKGRLPQAPLLPRPDGQSWQHSDQDELMRAAVKLARLPHGTVFYTLRHTFIASCLQSGIDIASVAKNCGTSVRIIERNYAKFIPENLSKQLNRVALM